MDYALAFVGVELERDCMIGEGKTRVVDALKNMPLILEIHETLAPFDLILKIRAENVTEMRRFIAHLANADGIMATNTQLVTNTIKE